MKLEYHFCRVKTDPEAGTVGDCMRAVIASMLGVQDPLTVPHFLHDGCDGETAFKRMREYLLNEHGLMPFNIAIDPEFSLQEALEFVHADGMNKFTYLLSGWNGFEDHVVICHENRVIFDPAWVRAELKGPAKSAGYWVVTVLVKAISP